MSAVMPTSQQSEPSAHPVTPDRNKDLDFIRHPDSYPLVIRSLSAWRCWYQPPAPATGIGLLFKYADYIQPGSWLSLTIRLRDCSEMFTGRCIRLREVEQGYEIGVRIADEPQSIRLRIVEQYCHMACYCRTRHNPADARTGLHIPDHEHEENARYWVTRFAASFPSL